MIKTLTKSLSFAAVAAIAGVIANGPVHAAEGGEHHIRHQHWSYGGILGHYDKEQLQRGFRVYKEVCSACHGLKRVYFRNLAEPGGPEFAEESVKALAAEWPNQITDGPNDEGAMFQRPARLSDPILGPYKNDKEARAAQNGALPPDLSLITRARNTHNEARWPMHTLLMARDVFTGYQEGGSNYLYALLTGYHETPAGYALADGMNYNAAFPGNQIAMPNVLDGGPVNYADGQEKYDGPAASQEQNARDVTAFLAWAADPSLNERKRIGWVVMLYLLLTTVLLYIGKRRLWSKFH
ncbi:MAG: cytochrome c1 [Hyphomicrobiaceae bacterium]